jgi:hypothetical protein
VRVRWRGGDPITVTGPFDHAGEPRAAADVVVFTAFLASDDAGDTDVYLFHADTGALDLVAGGPAQQRFADVSDALVAVTDFIEDPDGRFDQNDTDLADLDLYDRASHQLTRRTNPGKDAFPVLVGEGHLGYLHWGDVHPEPKFQAYGLRLASLAEPAAADVHLADVTSANAFVLPSANGDWFEWVTQDLLATTTDRAVLWRASAAASTPTPARATSAFDLGAPAPMPSATLIAARMAGGALTLRAVAR